MSALLKMVMLIKNQISDHSFFVVFLTIKMYNLFIYKHNKKYKNRLKSLKAFQVMHHRKFENRLLRWIDF